MLMREGGGDEKEREMEKSMVQIQRCDVVDCSYNKNKQCHTMAITVGGPEDACPLCDTYVHATQKGGVSDVIGGVGACKVDICKFNQALECTAQNIVVGLHQGHADCQTFKKK